MKQFITRGPHIVVISMKFYININQKWGDLVTDKGPQLSREVRTRMGKQSGTSKAKIMVN